MADATTLTLKNAAAANVLFDPYSVSSDQVEYVEQGAASILGMKRAKLSRQIPGNKATGVYRIRGTVSLPVINSTTGELNGTINCSFEVLRPAQLGNTDVNEAMARFSSFISQSVVAEAARSGAIPT